MVHCTFYTAPVVDGSLRQKVQKEAKFDGVEVLYSRTNRLATLPHADNTFQNAMKLLYQVHTHSD